MPSQVILVTCLFFQAPAANASGLLFSTLFKAGVEVDTNPRRVTGSDTEVDLVERFFLETDLASDGEGRSLSTGIRIGGKRFHETADEDTLIADLSAQAYQRLLNGLGISFRMFTRDRTERGQIRDYSRFSVQAGLNLSIIGLDLRAGPSLGYFLYKPDGDLSSRSLGAFSDLSYRVGESWVFQVSYNFTERTYRQRQVSSRESGLFLNSGQARIDSDHTLGCSVSYRTYVLSTLDLYWQRNLSNSYGKEFNRLIGRLTAAVPLPFGFIVNAQGSVQRTVFDEGVLIDPAFTVEDENRNSLSVAISRSITGWVRGEVRYQWYSQAFGGDETDYNRHLVSAGIILNSGEYTGRSAANWDGE